MATIAIEGHKTRGKEVIELLEMLGGINKKCLHGVTTELYYFIDNDTICSDESVWNYYTTFTLEEFLKKYPYKVGDKVIYDNSVHEIIEMKWSEVLDTISYGVSSGKIKNLAIVDELQPYKEQEIMDEIEIPDKAMSPNLIGEDYS